MRSLDMSTIKALILDMDGVIWKGDNSIGNLPDIFRSIEERGLQFIMATNNATLTIENFLNKLAGFGVQLKDWQVINSSLATVHYLHRNVSKSGPLYIIGEHGLIETLKDNGFYHAENDVLAVVVGLDRDLNYKKLKNASLLIQAGSPFIGTNLDPTLPTPEGLIPGAGTILAALETASGIVPTIIGKPAPEIYLLALERLGVTPEQSLVVGDRLETDIAGGQKLGCRTCVVLSGVATKEEAENWQPVPYLIKNDLMDLLSVL
jgi:4-nitrophenyl phosphatase